ncbi:uncharacterized protein LOC143915753 [Arctopsyche grandis]|uniref:uncharacterized protein LOC143915753 n=1 Tax=Arctopsyche grandis TaxID=121162 RepID=UPI00406D8C41
MRSIAYLSIISLVRISYQMPTNSADLRSTHDAENVKLYLIGDIGPESLYNHFPETSDSYGKSLVRVIAFYPTDLTADSNSLTQNIANADYDDDVPEGRQKREIGVEYADEIGGDLIANAENIEKQQYISSALGRKKIRFAPPFHG